MTLEQMKKIDAAITSIYENKDNPNFNLPKEFTNLLVQLDLSELSFDCDIKENIVTLDIYSWVMFRVDIQANKINMFYPN